MDPARLTADGHLVLPPFGPTARSVQRDLPDVRVGRAVQRDPKRRHGRQETRVLWTLTSAELNQYVGSTGVAGAAWPGVQQIGQLQRLVRTPQPDGTWQTTSELTYLITSLVPARATASQLLRRKRAHWAIECWHWVRDVTFGEDASRISRDQAPAVFAALRNAAISLLLWHSPAPLAATQRDLATRPATVPDLFSSLARRLVK